MDTTQSEKTGNPAMAVEQNIENAKETTEEIVIDKESAIGTCGESNELASKEETAHTVQKEVIEILNVELVAPRRDDFAEIEATDNEVSEAEVTNENSLDSDTAENSEPKQIPNKSYVEERKMDTIEIIVNPTPGENEPLANRSENVENNTEPTTSGLGLLSQYQSDDDDSVVEVPLTAAQDYRNQVFEIASDSDSDDSSSDSDVDYLNDLRKTIEKRIEIADDDEGDQEDQGGDGTDKRRKQQKLRVKGELLLEDLPPIQDLQITVPENDCIEFGKIHSIVDQLVLVSTLPNSILLDLETVIFLEKGQKVLGEVFDVLGQVADPLYCVRFNSNKQIEEKEIKVGDVVYVAPKTQYTQYIILSNLMQTKGSDASWENDTEPPPRFLDYSDDEQEQLARRQQRNKDRPNDNEDASKRSRTGDNEDSMPTSSSHNPNPQYKNRYEQRNNRGSPAGYSNTRPRYNGPHPNQQRAPNHHRSSWHSNYSPMNYPTQPPSNFRMPQNQPQPHQGYYPNMPPAYGMPNAPNMPYPPAQPAPYGAPHMFHQYPPQLMPPTFHGARPHGPHNPQYSSNPPPPPGSQ